MASRNERLYGAYLMAHIFSGGNCGDITRIPYGQNGPFGDVIGNDTKAAIALGQLHGRAGTEALSMERLVAKVDSMVASDPERSGGDLSAGKAAMEDLAKVAEGLKTGTCKVTVDNMAEASAKQPNAGDLADMKAATQGLGVVTENADSPSKSQWPLLDPKPSWVGGAYNQGDDTTVLAQAMKVLSEARSRGEIQGDLVIMVSVLKNPLAKSAASAK